MISCIHHSSDALTRYCQGCVFFSGEDSGSDWKSTPSDTDQSGDLDSDMNDRVSDTTSDGDYNASVIYGLSLGRAIHGVVGHTTTAAALVVVCTQQWVNDTSSSEIGCAGNGISEGQKEKPKGSKKGCKFCDKLNSKMSPHILHIVTVKSQKLLKFSKGEKETQVSECHLLHFWMIAISNTVLT